MLSKEERKKRGLVGKKMRFNRTAGKKILVNYEPDEDDMTCAVCSFFSPEEWKESMKRQSSGPRVVRYSETGEIIDASEEEENDDSTKN